MLDGLPQDITKLSIAQLSERIRSQEITPTELVAKALERIRRIDMKINSFITVVEEDAIRQAEVLERELKNNIYRSSLHGIPLSVKDIIQIRGVKCTAGSKILSNNVAEYDAAVVEKLREAGAIIVGTNNLHEFASGVTSVNPHFGAVRNPWDLERIAGGSSGGSAASVSACMVWASLGTDTSGSIRIPAALCGVVGLKPSYGRVSKHGVIPLSWSLDHVGPITRSVEDAAIVLKAIAGYDQRDDASVFADLPDYPASLEKNLKGYKLCVLRNLYLDNLHRSVARAFSRVIDVLGGLGVECVELDFRYADRVRWCWAPIRLGEAAAFHDEWLRERASDYGEDVRRMLERGRSMSLVDYVKAQRLRIEIREELLRILDKHHAIISPTTAIPAPKIGETEVKLDGETTDIYTALTNLTILYNITGVPAITIPAGLSGDNLPVAVQLAGRPFDEQTVLQLAYGLEKSLNLEMMPPALD